MKWKEVQGEHGCKLESKTACEEQVSGTAQCLEATDTRSLWPTVTAPLRGDTQTAPAWQSYREDLT